MEKILFYLFIFAAEGFTAWSYFDHIYERKTGTLIRTLSFAVGYLVLFFAAQQEQLILNLSSFLLINGLLLYGNYTCGKWAGVLQNVYLTAVMLATEVAVSFGLTATAGFFDVYEYSLLVVNLSGLLSRLLYFWIMQISARCLVPKKRQAEDIRTLLLLGTIPGISILIILLFGYINVFVEIPDALSTLITISVALLLCVNILVITLNNHIQKLQADKMTLMMEARREQENMAYYTMLQKQYDSQRVLIHDIRGHIATIQALAKEPHNEKLQQYTAQILQDPGLQNAVAYCEHRVLNMILVRYKSMCEELGIDIAYDIRSIHLPDVNDMELTALFENLLSNAVDAAKESAGKMIELSVKQDAGVLISLINSCDQPPVPDAKGGFHTKKLDASRHGVGLQSIRRVVDNHHGISAFFYDAANKQFHSVIQFLES